MTSDDVQRELERSIEATVALAAQRNEIRLAKIRASHLTVAVTALLVFHTWPSLLGDGAGVPLPTVIGGLFWLVVSYGIVFLERSHGYRAWVPWAATLVDVSMIVTFRVLAMPVNATMSIAATAIVSTLMTLMAALRLKRSWVWLAFSLAAVNLASVALTTGITISATLALLFMLLVAARLSAKMADITREAVESEVKRVVLQRFLPKTVIDAGDQKSLRLLTEPRSLDATVLISDIRSFTTFAEQRSPAEVLALLNVVQGQFADIVKENGGTVDKFMGDGMLAVFGAPDPTTDHADRAMATAQSMLERVEHLNVAFNRGGTPLRIGIGVHSGRIVTGVLGSGARMELTVIGDTVNIASRLEAMTKEKGVAALISNETLLRAERTHLEFQPLGTVGIRGRVQPLDVHTISMKGSLCTT
jgi:adenylate cyclase